jgi:hypothetical protein
MLNTKYVYDCSENTEVGRKVKIVICEKICDLQL